MTSWWRKSLTGRLVAAILGALLLSQIVSFLFVWQERKQVLENLERTEFMDRTMTIARLVEAVPPTLRDRVALASGTEYTRFWIGSGHGAEPSIWLPVMRLQFAVPLSDLLRAADAGIAGVEPEIRPAAGSAPAAAALADARIADTRSPPEDWPADLPLDARAFTFADNVGLGISVPLGDGTVFNASYYNHFSDTILSTPIPLTFGLTAALVALVAVVVIRRITKPLAQLTEAAETLGRGEPTVPLPETGPDDIRHTAIAFNRMQERLQRFVEDRTRMLAAIGHDLRTPLTTLRLRTEFVEDEELQSRMVATIEEMRSMTEAILALARQDIASEETRNVDLETLVESLCEDLAEVGADVSFTPGSRVPYRCRPDALRRAVRNLVENAVRYGERARVGIKVASEGIEIGVEDDGPGIPPERREDVFAPFFRLEESRNRETGGVGLGLSIARTIARQHGGDVMLGQGAGGGLRAAITLPK
ncbi:ATP-binding protein [Aureimonas psammosilenae]|uniref:ATP-binding protein n=1 Tax=Aureimonas psammosilenae TaxID=2495496 RepID=UPI001260B184|nr:ATP-binding protein [Aureimonas psammosilenae]